MPFGEKDDDIQEDTDVHPKRKEKSKPNPFDFEYPEEELLLDDQLSDAEQELKKAQPVVPAKSPQMEKPKEIKIEPISTPSSNQAVQPVVYTEEKAKVHYSKKPHPYHENRRFEERIDYPRREDSYAKPRYEEHQFYDYSVQNHVPHRRDPYPRDVEYRDPPPRQHFPQEVHHTDPSIVEPHDNQNRSYSPPHSTSHFRRPQPYYKRQDDYPRRERSSIHYSSRERPYETQPLETRENHYVEQSSVPPPPPPRRDVYYTQEPQAARVVSYYAPIAPPVLPNLSNQVICKCRKQASVTTKESGERFFICAEQKCRTFIPIYQTYQDQRHRYTHASCHRCGYLDCQYQTCKATHNWFGSPIPKNWNL